MSLSADNPMAICVATSIELKLKTSPVAE